jgi:hypothetical protein
MKKFRFLLMLLIVVTLITGVIARAQDEGVTFMSTQFNVVEETAKAQDIIGGFESGAQCWL